MMFNSLFVVDNYNIKIKSKRIYKGKPYVFRLYHIVKSIGLDENDSQ